MKTLQQRLTRLQTKRADLIQHLDNQKTDEFWAQGMWAGSFLGLMVGLLIGDQGAIGLYRVIMVCLLGGYLVGLFWGICKCLIGKVLVEQRLYEINDQIEAVTVSLERANQHYGVSDGAISPVRLEDQLAVNERSISLVAS